MAVTATPIFPQTPIIGIASVATALTVRTNITGTTGLTLLTATSTNGTRIDFIQATGAQTTTASLIWIWMYDGTTARLLDELVLAGITGSATAAAATISKSYTNLSLPPTYQLYASCTITQNVNVYAFGGQF